MDRPRVVLAAVVVSAFCGATGLIAQTAPSAEGWVVLPVEEYRALRERAIPPVPPPLAPPVEATLTRVDYDLRVGSDSISGRALLTIDVLKTGWTRVQIPAGLMVRDARLDGQPVSLVEGPPPHVWLAARRPRRADAGHRHPADGVGRHGIGRASVIAVSDIAGRAGAAEERCRPVGDRRLHCRPRRDRRAKAGGRHSGARTSRSPCRGSGRSTIDGRSCRSVFARG